MWGALVGCGFMKRVDWVEIGQELQEELVETSDVEDGSSTDSTPTRASFAAHTTSAAVPASAARVIQRSASDQLLEQLLRSEDAESWMAESPAIRHEED